VAARGSEANKDARREEEGCSAARGVRCERLTSARGLAGQDRARPGCWGGGWGEAGWLCIGGGRNWNSAEKEDSRGNGSANRACFI
jgi:hypothetical protein